MAGALLNHNAVRFYIVEIQWFGGFARFVAVAYFTGLIAVIIIKSRSGGFYG